MSVCSQRVGRSAGFLSVLMAAMVLKAGAAMAYGFSSPSGNILCWDDKGGSANESGTIYCLILQENWSTSSTRNLPRDPECGLDETWLAILPKGGKAKLELACHGDVFWDNYATQFTLPYGKSAYLGDSVCVSSKKGVRCTNADGYGFNLRRANYELY